MPTAPGASGAFYQVWVSVELDSKIRERALQLHKKGLIRDVHGNPVKLRQDEDGPYVPRYAVGKYALLQLVNGGVRKK